MENKPKKDITITEASKILGVSPKALKRWEENGKITPFRDPITNCRHYDHDEIQKIMSEREMADSEINEITDDTMSGL